MNSLNSFDTSTNQQEDFDIEKHFRNLLETKTGIDVTFVLEDLYGEKRIFAHQLLLARRSSYFAERFYGNDKSKENNIIHLENINPKAFENMIRYSYGWKPVLETTEEACALFKVANQFKVMSLMNLCVRHIEIEPGNVFRMLEVSEDKTFRDNCNKLIEDKTREVMASYDLQDITPSMVHIILDLPKLSLYSEYELIKWVFDWAKVKSKEADSGCKSTREYLEKLLQKINFMALTLEEFAMVCKDYPDFFSSDEIVSIYLNIAFPGTREMPKWYNKDVRDRVYIRSMGSSYIEEIIHQMIEGSSFLTKNVVIFFTMLIIGLLLKNIFGIPAIASLFISALVYLYLI